MSARPEDENLGPRANLVYGIQHILTMYGGLIAPPLIVGSAAGLSPTDIGLLVTAGIFVSGLATLLQSLGVGPFGARLPIVQGISFASVSTMVSIASHDGIRSVFGAIIVAGVIGVVVSSFFAQLVRIFPPVVTGSIITVIGVSLLPVAFDWALGGVGAPSYGSMVALPPIFGFGTPVFDVAGIVAMTIMMLVIMTETMADILALGEILGTRVDHRRVANGLRADMLSSTVAPVFGAFPASAFAQNVGLVAITGIKSRFTVAFGGGVLVLLGLVPVFGRVVAAIPPPVLGGAGIVLFGSVAASGIRTLSKVDYAGNLNLVIVAVALGVGLVPIARPDFWSRFPSGVAVVMDSGISAASIVAVLMNLFFNQWRWRSGTTPSAIAAAAPDERGTVPPPQPA